VSASTCFASRSSLPRFLTALGRSQGVLHLVSATAPLPFWASDPPTSGRKGELRPKFHKHYDPVSASRYVASSVCYSTRIPYPLHNTLPHCLCFLPYLGSSYAGCVRVGGCWHVGCMCDFPYLQMEPTWGGKDVKRDYTLGTSSLPNLVNARN
jgi:hypothetical protein